jgi:hypothetical protein
MAALVTHVRHLRLRIAAVQLDAQGHFASHESLL